MKLLLALILALSSCASTVSRDAATYRAELEWFTNTALSGTQHLETLLKKQCQCVEGSFQEGVCLRAARHIQAVRTRAPYHRDMALFNAGLITTQPSSTPPVVLSEKELCP